MPSTRARVPLREAKSSARCRRCCRQNFSERAKGSSLDPCRNREQAAALPAPIGQHFPPRGRCQACAKAEISGPSDFGRMIGGLHGIRICRELKQRGSSSLSSPEHELPVSFRARRPFFKEKGTFLRNVLVCFAAHRAAKQTGLRATELPFSTSLRSSAQAFDETGRAVALPKRDEADAASDALQSQTFRGMELL